MVRPVRSVARVFFAIVIVLGALEADFRFDRYRLSLVYDGEAGCFRSAPGEVLWGIEGDGVSHWSPDGTRIVADGVASRRARQVLVIGDSFTEALQVSDGEEYVSIAQRELERAGSTTRLVNLGLSTRSVADYVDLATAWRERFDGAWVVVQIHDDDLEADAYATDRTHFDTHSDGSLFVTHVSAVERRSLGAWIWDARQSSSVVGLGFVRGGALIEMVRSEPPIFRAADTVHAAPAQVRRFPVERELDMLFGAYQQRLTVLHVPTLNVGSANHVSETERRIAHHCHDNAISFASAREAMEHALETGHAPAGFPNSTAGEGHLNDVGHRAVGTTLAAELSVLAQRGVL